MSVNSCFVACCSKQNLTLYCALHCLFIISSPFSVTLVEIFLLDQRLQILTNILVDERANDTQIMYYNAYMKISSYMP